MLDKIALVLVIIGAINWGSIGIFQFDLVEFIAGSGEAMLARVIYTVIAVAGVWCISLLFRERDDEHHHGAGRVGD